MIKAKVIADSINPNGKRLTTLEVVIPRIILAEFNTHRAFSRNSASSRAIPFKRMVETVSANPFIPLAFQKDHKGMQGREYLEGIELESAIHLWVKARNKAVISSVDLNTNDVTKQLCNRLLESFMYHKVLVSATEWSNFFKLRCPEYHYDGAVSSCRYKMMTDFPELKEYTELDWLKINHGQGEIHIMKVAEEIQHAIFNSTPEKLDWFQYHIPYNEQTIETTLENQLAVSVARCARVSYSTIDKLGKSFLRSLDQDLSLFNKLKSSGHWSPFEHIAKAHSGRSRNFDGFIQYRSELDGSN